MSDTQTITPSGTGWTYAGSVTHVSGSAQLTENRVYLATSGATADLDLSTLIDGTSLDVSGLGWVVVAGTLTKETNSGVPVIQGAGSWGGAYLSGLDFENVYLEGTVQSLTDRANLVVRFDPTATSGYVIQARDSNNTWGCGGQVPTSFAGINDVNSNAANITNFPFVSVPYDVAIQAYSSTGISANIVTSFYNDEIRNERDEYNRVDGAGVVAIQNFGTSRYSSFAVYSGTDGTATVTMTPNSISKWVSVCVSGDLTKV